MTKYSVTLKVQTTYQIEVEAPDKAHIWNWQNPCFSKSISKNEIAKLANPEEHAPYQKREIKIMDVKEIDCESESDDFILLDESQLCRFREISKIDIFFAGETNPDEIIPEEAILKKDSLFIYLDINYTPQIFEGAEAMSIIKQFPDFLIKKMPRLNLFVKRYDIEQR